MVARQASGCLARREAAGEVSGDSRRLAGRRNGCERQCAGAKRAEWRSQPTKMYTLARSTTAKTTGTETPNPMKSLLSRLRSIGLPTPYVRQFLLPDWWDDEAAASPVGFTQVVWTIARHLGIRPELLRDPTQAITLPRQHGVQFKLTKGTDEQSVELARILGQQVARFALLGVTQLEAAACAKDIRTAILESGAPWISFGTLLDYCWSIGIPVLHLSKLPGKKMDGMAVNIDGKSAIVLASGRTGTAWLLFHLAHELGHIALGHGTVVDGTIDEESSDPLEKEANDFAIELITGRVGARVVPQGRWPKADGLAETAQRLGSQEGVDPGHIVLNYAHGMSRGGTNNFWPVANAALKKIPSEGDAAAMIRERMAAKLDWSSLPTEAAEFVARMTAGQP